MNREQRRKLEKRLRGVGASMSESKDLAKTIQENYESSSEIPVAKEIEDGTRVMIDVESIVNKESFFKMSQLYQKFILDSRGKVFTAVREKNKKLISLKEEPKWLFWSGNLIVVDDKGSDDE